MSTDESPRVERLVLELCCCCCGRVLDTLPTKWCVGCVAETKLWTTEPCAPCRLELQALEILGH